MRLVHTSDWHIGKNLDNVSRLEEQEKFLNDFIELVEDKNVDMVIIAGDIYDTYNPPAAAEALFYKTIKRLSNGGRRCVFVIAGNHDSPEKLESIIPLVEDDGIIVLGYPKSVAKIGRYKNFEVLNAESGFTKISFNGEIVNIISLPYPSEKRLNDVFEKIGNLEDMQKTYTNKVGEIFRKHEEKFNEDEINIATSHLFVVGSNISDSERRIELGGSLLVDKNDLPHKSQYTALGHIHKPQLMSKTYNAYYSGSPIQYSKNERDVVKSVNVVELSANSHANVEKVFINNYRPIRVFKCDSLDDAFEIVEKYGEEDIYSYFEIKTEEAIDLESMKKIKKSMKYVMEIRPIFIGEDDRIETESIDISMGNIKEYFVDFFKKNKAGLEPSEEIINLFLDFVSEVNEDETN